MCYVFSKFAYKKQEAIPITDRGGPLGCETSRLPYFLDSRLIDGSKVVSPTRRPLFTPRNIPGTHISSKIPDLSISSAGSRAA
jgi:hypothetical protein